MSYKYQLKCPYTYSGLRKKTDRPTTVRFRDQDDEIRLLIDNDDVIVVKEGYAWDGCSPSFSFLDLFWMGSPDGVNSYSTGYPKTYYASLVHDALCQFSRHEEMPFTRKEIDRIFFKMLKEYGFKLARVYYMAVRLFSILLFRS